MVNEPPVRILLECILVLNLRHTTQNKLIVAVHKLQYKSITFYLPNILSRCIDRKKFDTHNFYKTISLFRELGIKYKNYFRTHGNHSRGGSVDLCEGGGWRVGGQ